MVTSKTYPETGSSLVSPLPPSSPTEIDQALANLSTHKDTWAMLDIQGRIALLDQVKTDLPGIETRWIQANMAARDANMETPSEGVEWTNLSLVYKQIHALHRSLQDIARLGTPRLPGKISTRPNGQVVVQVHPYDWKEQISLAGMHAEVWMDPSVSMKGEGIPQAEFYRRTE